MRPAKVASMSASEQDSAVKARKRVSASDAHEGELVQSDAY